MLEFIETVIIHPDLKIHIYKGSFGNFIKKMEISGKLLDIPFDENISNRWIIDEKRYWDDDTEKYLITGPITCNRCRKNGFWNGVFIGYCNVCAEIHEQERGLGLFHSLTDKGIPYEAHHGFKKVGWWGGNHVYAFPKEKSMWNTYLKDIDFEKIGDENLKEKFKNGYYSDSDTNEEEIKGYYCNL